MIEIQTRPATEESVTPLKLSEALRLGAMSTEQWFGEMTDGHGRYCAMGTISHAIGIDDGDMRYFPSTFLTPARDELRLDDGCCRQTLFYQLWMQIAHLNDFHRLPRERIADLLEEAGL